MRTSPDGHCVYLWGSAVPARIAKTLSPGSVEWLGAFSADPGFRGGKFTAHMFDYTRLMPILRLFSPLGTRTRRVAGTAPKAVGRIAVGVGTSSFLFGRCAAGAATGFEHPWRPPGRGVRHPHLPLLARQRSPGMRRGLGFKWRGNG